MFTSVLSIKYILIYHKSCSSCISSTPPERERETEREREGDGGREREGGGGRGREREREGGERERGGREREITIELAIRMCIRGVVYVYLLIAEC